MDFGSRWRDMIDFLRQLEHKGMSHLVHKVNFLMPKARISAKKDVSMSILDAANVTTAAFELGRLNTT